jgi:hypothetical protein
MFYHHDLTIRHYLRDSLLLASNSESLRVSLNVVVLI